MRSNTLCMRVAIAFSILSAWQLLAVSAVSGEETKVLSPDEMKAEFIKLCDRNAPMVEGQIKARERKATRVFYWDSYVVRALCAAYDETGKKEYLDTCKRWSDLMIEFQKGMIPEGAYYMQYLRKPGEKEGPWYVADSTSIALAVLATAVRCDGKEKEKYLDSVKAFAKLVIENYLRPSGGITNGHWPKSDKEWWCSSGIFGSLSFLLYKETGDEKYLKVGLGAIDWLNKQHWLTMAEHYPKIVIDPTVMAYCLEAYSPAFPYLERGSERYKGAMAQWEMALKWMKENQGGQGKRSYVDQWGSKMGLLPYHMYKYAHNVPGSEKIEQAADKEMSYMQGVLDKAPEKTRRDQLALFMMMSYAERLYPGKMYRSSKE
jgi:rhamnogalacturonyl hydrolase YesR